MHSDKNLILVKKEDKGFVAIWLNHFLSGQGFTVERALSNLRTVLYLHVRDYLTQNHPERRSKVDSFAQVSPAFDAIEEAPTEYWDRFNSGIEPSSEILNLYIVEFFVKLSVEQG